MLTVLRAVFALLAVAWALHDGQAARDRHSRDKR
jgi:hypothetical protein